MKVEPHHLYLALTVPIGVINWAVGQQITMRARELGRRRERLKEDPRFKGLGNTRIGPDAAMVHLVWSNPSDLPEDLQRLIRWQRRLSTVLALVFVGCAAWMLLSR